MVTYQKNVVGARYGLADWLLHRPATFRDWQAMFAGGFVRLATVLFVAALCYHAWIGVRDIVMDYLKPVSVRLTALFLVAFFLIACFAWSVAILWGR